MHLDDNFDPWRLSGLRAHFNRAGTSLRHYVKRATVDHFFRRGPRSIHHLCAGRLPVDASADYKHLFFRSHLVKRGSNRV